MQNKKFIRFAESLILLPLFSVSMPLGGVPVSENVNYPEIVMSQKQNIEMGRLLAFNHFNDDSKEEDAKEEMFIIQAHAIDKYFADRDMPLEGTGLTMAIEADKNGLDWRLLPAIAVRESTGGKHECNRVENNAFGWGSCKIGFDSNEKAIETVARNLGGNNPRTAHHYDNKTTIQILRAYNPPSVIPKYAEQVMSIMKAFGSPDMVLMDKVPT